MTIGDRIRLLGAATDPDAPLAEQIEDRLKFTRLAIRLCLVVVAVYGLLRGLAYLPAFNSTELPPGLLALSYFIPIWVWAIVWIIAGLGGGVAVKFVRPWGTVGVVFMASGWAVGYTVAWVMSWPVFSGHPMSRDYLSASQYWTVCLLLIGGRYLAELALEGWSVARKLAEKR